MPVVDIWCYVTGSDKQRHCFRIRARSTDTVYDLKKRIVQERPVKTITEASQLYLYKCPFPSNLQPCKSTKKQQITNMSSTPMKLHATSKDSVDNDDYNICNHIDSSNTTHNQSGYCSRLLNNQQLVSSVLPELFQLEFTSLQQKWISLRVSLRDKWAPVATFKPYNRKVGIAVSIQQDSMNDLRKLLRSSFKDDTATDKQQTQQKTASLEGNSVTSVDQSERVYILNQQHGQITSLNQLRESQVYNVVIGQNEWQEYVESISAEDRHTTTELAKQSAELGRLTNIAERLIDQLIAAANAIKQQSKAVVEQPNAMNNKDTTEKSEMKVTSHDSTITMPQENVSLDELHSNLPIHAQNNNEVADDRTTPKQADPFIQTNLNRSINCPANNTILVPDPLRETDTSIDGINETSDGQHNRKRCRVERICSTPPKRIRSSSINQSLTRKEFEELRQTASAVVELNRRTKQVKKSRPEPPSESKSRYPPVNLNDVFGHNRKKNAQQSTVVTSSTKRQDIKESNHQTMISVDHRQFTDKSGQHQQTNMRFFTSNVLSSKSTIENQTNTNSKVIGKNDKVNKKQTNNVVDNNDSNDDDNLSDITDIPTPPGLREFLELRDAQTEQARKKGLIPISDLKFPVNAPGYKEPEVKGRQMKLSSMYFSKTRN